jgi:spore coat protein U-like protein
MKLVTAAAASLALFSAPAFAQTGNEFSFDIQGQIVGECGAENLSIGSVANLILNGNEQALGSIRYVCNATEGFTRTIHSANAGMLNDNGNAIPYTISHGGVAEIAFPPTSLAVDLVTEVPPSDALLTGISGVLSAAASGTGFPAGTYTDTVTVIVAAN